MKSRALMEDMKVATAGLLSPLTSPGGIRRAIFESFARPRTTRLSGSYLTAFQVYLTGLLINAF